MYDALYTCFLIILLVFLVCCVVLGVLVMSFILYTYWCEYKLARADELYRRKKLNTLAARNGLDHIYPEVDNG